MSLLGLAIVLLAVLAILKRVDVRLALFLAAMALGLLAGQPDAIVRKFLITLTDDQFVIPICTAMGFAYVLRQTACDRHLVQLLVRPLQRVRALLIPGAVIVGFLVNIPVVSQTSTVVAIGSVLFPLLLAARVPAVSAGAGLLLGCSIGGELLNPAAPEYRTVTVATGAPLDDCVRRVLPLLVPHVALATLVFWVLTLRWETWNNTGGWEEAGSKKAEGLKKEALSSIEGKGESVTANEEACSFRVNYFKAIVPIIPITLLFMAGRPLELIHVPRHWLAAPTNPADLVHFDSRLIGAAMLVGVVVAALTAGREALGSAKAFFEGAGYAFTNIISVIVTAACLGEGIKLVGIARELGDLITTWPRLLVPTAGALPLAFAWVSGSGMASTQSLYGFFVDPSHALHIDPVQIGAVVSIAAAAGRTMSPVAAVTLMCATLTDTNPFALVRRVAVPLFAGMAVVIVMAIYLV
jgi:DcuC family C4-dicarboxylate transporter